MAQAALYRLCLPPPETTWPSSGAASSMAEEAHFSSENVSVSSAVSSAVR